MDRRKFIKSTIAIGAAGIAIPAAGHLMNKNKMLERLMFPYLSYYGLTPCSKKVPTSMFYTMNVNPEQVRMSNLDVAVFEKTENMMSIFWEKPERVCAYNTYQVKDYSQYDFHPSLEPQKRAWREEHFEDDKRKAFEAGIHMAEKIMA